MGAQRHLTAGLNLPLTPAAVAAERAALRACSSA